MFGFLKKKLSEAVDSLSGKAKKKSEEPQDQIAPEIQRIEESIQEMELPKSDDVFSEPAEPEPKNAEPQTEEEPAEKEEAPLSEEGPAQETPAVAEGAPAIPEEAPVETQDGQLEETVREEAPEDTLKEPAAEPQEAAPMEPAGVEEHTEEEPEAPKTEPEKIAEPTETLETPAAAQEPERKSFFQKLTERVVKKVAEKKLSEDDVAPLLSDLEASLIESDVALEVAEKIKSDLRSALVDREIKRGKEKETVVNAFRSSLMGILDVPKMDFDSLAKQKKPVVVVFWGFNGAGKTTSLAKTASWLKGKGYSCVLAAGDTFRAGAEEQLDIHAGNIGVKSVKHQYGADPAAVIFDAVEHAKAKGLDFVLADTAGRAHTNANLMDQMRKIVRVNKPDVKILVIDSLTGNDALMQARMYGEIGVDAVIFTKVDVNEKGGAILSVTNELKKPILFLGMGQDYSHFQEFDAAKFVDNVLED